MTDNALNIPEAAETAGERRRMGRRSVWGNLLSYVLKRVLLLGITVVTSVFLIVFIANLGGYVDRIVASRIEFSVGMRMMDGWLSELPLEERRAVAEQTIAAMKDAAGLNDPFLLRTVRWAGDGLTLNWGRARGSTTGALILDNMSRSLLVFGVATLLTFGTSVWLALSVSRRRGGWLERLFILLSPISAAPAWVYGVLLSALFIRVFGFSTGGTFDRWDYEWKLTHILIILRHLLLPFLAIFLAGLFQTVYLWRSYFQVYSDEDYVELAQAKGLSSNRINRNYIVRPALPALITQFGLLPVVLWQELIALEYFFNVQGLGRLFVGALNAFSTPLIVAIVTVFAYLAAITVFVLDICYMLVDPRVRLGNIGQEGTGSGAARGRPRSRSRAARRSEARPQLTLSLPRPSISGIVAALWRGARQVGQTIWALRAYPSAVFGLAFIVFLLGMSVYTAVAMPYEQAISRWRGDGNVWSRYPREALPAWINRFRRDELPLTMAFDSRDPDSGKLVEALGDDLTNITIPFTIEYSATGGFPQDIVIDLNATYQTRGPHVTLTWVWPDGSERELAGFQPTRSHHYYISRDERLQRRFSPSQPQEALFMDPDGGSDRPVPGTYQLRIEALLFEPDTDVDARVTVLGQVYGLAGTDARRRDLIIPLLWGTPVALAFGLIAAITTSVGSMLVAAVGAWYGRAVDRGLQFVTEVNLILPFFPVALMIFIMYSKNIVTILAVIIALTIFGSATKTYRAAFLQIRAEPYIEAARAYGASNWRIVVRYMLPRIMPVLIPQLIILVPAFVFLEATLAFLGVSDPVLPTWGKLVVAALGSGIHTGATHIVLLPLGILFLTGFAFAMIGLALARVFASRGNVA
jgi:peptide/nickel transport system permease protein